MKDNLGLLLFGFFLVLAAVKTPVHADWISNLHANLEEVNKQINTNLNRVEKELQHNLARINEDVQKQVADAQAHVKNVEKQLKEHEGTAITVGNAGTVVNNGSVVYALNGYGGSASTLTISQQIGDKIYVNETIYDLASKTKTTREYVIDLNNSDIKPMEAKNEKA